MIEDVSLFKYLCFFVIMIFLFAAFYTYLTPYGHGIGQNLIPLRQTTFSNGIYFSLITVSSLGYSDLHPIGFSRAIACIEVMMGILMTGVFIARIASRRLSYHVSRLYGEHSKKRLKELTQAFTSVKNSIRIIFELHGTFLQDSPRLNHESDAIQFDQKFRNIVDAVYMHSTELHDHIMNEMLQRNYFEVIPTEAIRQTSIAVDEALYALSQLLISMSVRVRLRVLLTQHRQKIAMTISLNQAVCDTAAKNLADAAAVESFRQLRRTCKAVSESLTQGPEEILPNQVVLRGSDPLGDGVDPR